MNGIEAIKAGLRYIRHVGMNKTERGEPHPQQLVIDTMETSIQIYEDMVDLLAHISMQSGFRYADHEIKNHEIQKRFNKIESSSEEKIVAKMVGEKECECTACSNLKLSIKLSALENLRKSSNLHKVAVNLHGERLFVYLTDQVFLSIMEANKET